MLLVAWFINDLRSLIFGPNPPERWRKHSRYVGTWIGGGAGWWGVEDYVGECWEVGKWGRRNGKHAFEYFKDWIRWFGLLDWDSQIQKSKDVTFWQNFETLFWYWIHDSRDESFQNPPPVFADVWLLIGVPISISYIIPWVPKHCRTVIKMVGVCVEILPQKMHNGCEDTAKMMEIMGTKWSQNGAKW